MGFKTGRILKSDIFKPIELNEGNVQAIFKRCLADEKSSDILRLILFSKRMGYQEDSLPINFDRKKVASQQANIKFLFGQLQIIHENKKIAMPSEFSKKYTGEEWTKNNGVLLELLHLGASCPLMMAFLAKDNRASLYHIPITLSPKDPNFPAWWAEHKSEWEEAPKKEN